MVLSVVLPYNNSKNRMLEYIIRKPTLDYNSLGIAPSISPLSNDAPDCFIPTELKRLNMLKII